MQEAMGGIQIPGDFLHGGNSRALIKHPSLKEDDWLRLFFREAWHSALHHQYPLALAVLASYEVYLYVMLATNLLLSRAKEISYVESTLNLQHRRSTPM